MVWQTNPSSAEDSLYCVDFTQTVEALLSYARGKHQTTQTSLDAAQFAVSMVEGVTKVRFVFDPS